MPINHGDMRMKAERKFPESIKNMQVVTVSEQG
jgi:hypothetical protein